VVPPEQDERQSSGGSGMARLCRTPFGDTADYQSAILPGRWSAPLAKSQKSSLRAGDGSF